MDDIEAHEYYNTDWWDQQRALLVQEEAHREVCSKGGVFYFILTFSPSPSLQRCVVAVQTHVRSFLARLERNKLGNFLKKIR